MSPVTRNLAILLIVFCLAAPAAVVAGPPKTRSTAPSQDVFEWTETRLMNKLALVQAQNEITPFVSDGCSGGMSASWSWLAKTIPAFRETYGNRPPWHDCCVAHDKAYWQGEAAEGYEKRRRADLRLKQCVIETGVRLQKKNENQDPLSGESFVWAFEQAGMSMYNAVRLGGGPCSLFSWRWGFGWPLCPLVSNEPDEDGTPPSIDEN